MKIELDEFEFLKGIYDIEKQNKEYQKTFQSILDMLDSQNDMRAEISSVCQSMVAKNLQHITL